MKTTQLIVGIAFTILFMGAFPTSCTSGSTVMSQTGPTPSLETKGVLIGKVMKSPTCPVERAGMPCAPKPVSGIKLSIISLNGRETFSVTTDNRGVYSSNLAPGAYRIDMASHSGIGLAGTKDLPTTVAIVAGQQTRLDITIDTGIR